MKTAMQELIEEMEYCYKDHNIFLKSTIEKAKKLLEKEKEQIIDASNSAFEDKTTWGERYYNQTYNQEPKKEYQPSEEYLKKQRDNMEDFVWNKMNNNNQKNGI